MGWQRGRLSHRLPHVLFECGLVRVGENLRTLPFCHSFRGMEPTQTINRKAALADCLDKESFI